MRRTLTVIALLVATPFIAFAAPRDDAKAAFEQFFTNFTAADAEAVVRLFAPDALFYGTSSREIVTTTDGIRAYFVAAFGTPPRAAGAVPATQVVEPSIVMVSDQVAVISSIWQTTRVDGSIGGPFRVTAMLADRGQGWQIVQFHNSPVPAPPAP